MFSFYSTKEWKDTCVNISLNRNTSTAELQQNNYYAIIIYCYALFTITHKSITHLTFNICVRNCSGDNKEVIIYIYIYIVSYPILVTLPGSGVLAVDRGQVGPWCAHLRLG